MSPEETALVESSFSSIQACIASDGSITKQPSDQKEDRGYVDGCFDLCHSGHFNAIRQAANQCHTLCIGPNADADILQHKGPVILNSEERCEIIRAVKWGDEVWPDMPYEPSEAVLDELNAQYYIHGDDPVMVDGVNVIEALDAAGRFKEIRRTTGVSTTNLTGKLLALLDYKEEEEKELADKQLRDPPKQTFLQTSNRIANFSNRREPKLDDEVVYFQLSCDLMHPGVIERIMEAKKQGTFLYVGLWDDQMIKYYRGARYPLQGMQERLLMALALKYVDDVVIGAPYIITSDLITSLNISKVVHVQSREDQVKAEHAEIDPFKVPREQGKFVELPPVKNDLTVEDIAQRIANNKASFQKKFLKKKESEDDYYLRLKKSIS